MPVMWIWWELETLFENFIIGPIWADVLRRGEIEFEQELGQSQ